jgi:lipopolysaccharide/colanic/teichoic acid biosynthesis glycosyltransferase
MSLIKSRPERSEFEHELEDRIPHYRNRHWIPPGMSGWAQVCLPSVASVAETEIKLSHDLYHLNHWGVTLDQLILLKTVLKPGGAEAMVGYVGSGEGMTRLECNRCD